MRSPTFVRSGSRRDRATRPNQWPVPHIISNALTAHIVSPVPIVTGKDATPKANQLNRESRDRLLASTRSIHPQKQIDGMIVSISIQASGVADQSFLKPQVT